MRILFTSDLHGLDSVYQKFAILLKADEFDIGVLAGDLMTYPSREEMLLAKEELSKQFGETKSDTSDSPAAVVRHALAMKEKLYKTTLFSAGKPIAFLMGNDDGILGDGREWTSEHFAMCINQKRIAYGQFNLVGYQYTTPFVRGSFEKPEVEQEKDLRQLEKLIDSKTILITHGPAWGILDIAWDGKHVGCRALADMLKRKPVWLHLFGHIHNSFGVQGNSVNGAYPLAQKFVSIDVDSRKISAIK